MQLDCVMQPNLMEIGSPQPKSSLSISTSRLDTHFKYQRQITSSRTSLSLLIFLSTPNSILSSSSCPQVHISLAVFKSSLAAATTSRDPSQLQRRSRTTVFSASVFFIFFFFLRNSASVLLFTRRSWPLLKKEKKRKKVSQMLLVSHK